MLSSSFYIHMLNKCWCYFSKLSVYEGVKSFYKEEDEAVPVNMYGKSKVAAEQFISSNWPSFVILRSSIIYGPQTVSPVTKSLPIQVQMIVCFFFFINYFMLDIFQAQMQVLRRLQMCILDTWSISNIGCNRWLHCAHSLVLTLRRSHNQMGCSAHLCWL